jgi:hypothetical protein
MSRTFMIGINFGDISQGRRESGLVTVYLQGLSWKRAAKDFL